MAYSALLDANVLHPVILCDTLLRFAEKGFFRPLWSAEILEETVASIARRRTDLPRAVLERRIEHMQAAFPDALVTGHATLAGTLANEFGGDAHVVAAAVTASADVIVTHNVRDFPALSLQPHGVLVQTPDAFLVHQWWRDPEIAARVLVEQSTGTRRPHLPPLELLDKLGRLVPGFAALARGSTELTRLLS